MPYQPPANPDLKRELKARLLAMTPRAFELFAGDLLVFVGLQNVFVTRYVGDGGLDARGDMVSDSGIIRIPTGVQVKRHRHNVQRPDIDRFIGALSGQFSHGIFITASTSRDFWNIQRKMMWLNSRPSSGENCGFMNCWMFRKVWRDKSVIITAEIHTSRGIRDETAARRRSNALRGGRQPLTCTANRRTIETVEAGLKGIRNGHTAARIERSIRYQT
jgi:restriction endonuclease Mrr